MNKYFTIFKPETRKKCKPFYNPKTEPTKIETSFKPKTRNPNNFYPFSISVYIYKNSFKNAIFIKLWSNNGCFQLKKRVILNI